MSAAILILNANALIEIVNAVVSDNIDVRLDTQVMLLEHAVHADGTLDEKALAPFRDLAVPPADWGWDVVTPTGHWHKGINLGDVEFPRPRVHVDQGIYSGRGYSSTGIDIHIRRRRAVRSGFATMVTVIAPSSLIDKEVERVRKLAFRHFAGIVLLLVVTAILQLRIGLRPLRQLGENIARIRNGDMQTLPDRQPADLQPLAHEVNALIERNQASLEVARLNAANLAHSVKTPLATLLLELGDSRTNENARALVRLISDRVAHHLSRARSAAIGLGTRARCDAAVIAGDVVDAVQLVHRREGIEVENLIEAPCSVAVDQHDLTEMLGNLVENACRYAHRRVTLSALAHGQQICLTLADDGDGVPEDQLEEVLQPGVRLDSVNEGYGLGLALVRELAELYGGRLSLENRTDRQGLHANLYLPR